MDLGQPEEIILDENAEAAKHSFYILGGLETSPDHKLIAYAEDVSGGEKYTIHVRELATGKQLLKAPIQAGPCAQRSCFTAASSPWCARL